MKRKLNLKLMIAAFVLVLLSFGICILGITCGSVYIKTPVTPSENIKGLFESFRSGNGDESTKHTKSYKRIIFDAEGENEAVQLLCNALRKNYSYTQEPAKENESSSLVSANTVRFSTLDLNKIEKEINVKFGDYISDALKSFNSNEKLTTSDGKYLPEIYEKAYLLALTDLLQNPSAYYTDEQLQLNSSYNASRGMWNTAIDNKLAAMLQGCLPYGISADTLALPDTIRDYVDNSLSILKGEPLKTTRKYTLPYSSTVAPKPDASKYSHIPVDQADKVLDIISNARACGLLGDQSVIFDPNTEFYPEDIVCYFDESILVICWKEYINGCVCNCMEVKIADGSQLKRKLSGDAFNSGVLDTVSNMSAATNAVAAINGDYYAYRDLGVSVYQGTLNRYQLSCEVLMINDKGNFVFYYPDGKSATELQEYINNENIQFSLAFGPVLIDNYTPRYYQDGYAFKLGEMKECYSRAAFGEFDDLHYLFMTSGYSENTVPPANLDAFIEILRTKNLKNAYNVDGGQTAEMVIQNSPYNHIDYGGERQVSDMVFFATAIQESDND